MRDPTRTIETLDFQYGKARFRVLDVGGQRMERPKWNLTGEITAVIFVCALTEYNQVLREDIKQNRLKESINLFDIVDKAAALAEKGGQAITSSIVLQRLKDADMPIALKAGRDEWWNDAVPKAK